MATVVAGAAAISGFWSGAFDLETWGPAAMVLLALLLVLVFAFPAVPRGVAAVAMGSLLLLSCWALLSALWAASAERALAEGYRLVFYSAAFALLLLCAGRTRPARRIVPLAAAAAGIGAVALYVLAKMIAGDAQQLFVAARLVAPLDYFSAEASFFLLAFWPLMAAAVAARRPALGGVAVGSAAILLSLVVLTQSRGAIVAVGATAIVLLALARSGRLAWTVIAALGGSAAALPALLEVTSGPSIPVESDLRTAALAALGGGLLAGLAWAAIAAIVARPTRERGARIVARASAAGLALMAAAAIAGAAVAATRADDLIDDFKSLEEPTQGARLLSAGGNRYDYWRVALLEFKDEPLAGVGAGNYDLDYFLERHTNEDIRQPHSLELQVLAELGVVGGALLLAFVVSVLAALVLARRGKPSSRPSSLVIAGGGAFLVWLVHTSVDWIHLVPGNTTIALAGVAAVLSPWVRPAQLSSRRRVGALIVVGALCAAAAAGAVAIGRATVADRFADDAQTSLASDPRGALDSTADSLSFNGRSLRTLYLRAAAFARLGEPGAARSTLLEALELEPDRFVTWALLGDLAVRRGELTRARRYYRRAYLLNPRDALLQRLATDRGLLQRLSDDPDLGSALAPAQPAP